VILASDLLSGVVVATIALLGIGGWLRIEFIYVAAVFFGAASAFYLPAMSSILPDLVPHDVLVAGNSLHGLSRQVNRVIGPLLGGVLVSALGSPVAFAVDAATFFISFAIFLLSTEPPAMVALRRSLWVELKEGFEFAASVPWIWITIWAFAVINFFEYAPISIGLPLLVHFVLGGGAKVFGLIASAAGVGEIVASLVVGQFRINRLGIFLYLVTAAEGLAILSIGLVPVLAVAMFGNAIFAAGVVAFTIHWDSALQRLVPRRLLGRVTSLDWFGAILLGPAAPIFAALVAQNAGPRAIFVICGAAAAILSLAGLTIPAIRRLNYGADSQLDSSGRQSSEGT
jgi:MFS family permease